MQNTKTLKLVEGAIMVALAVVLSFIKFKFLPFGGSITLVSMMPIMIYSIRHGVAWGMLASLIYALIQMFLDLGEVIGWGLNVTMLIGCLLFDYIIAFSVLGLAGMFRNKNVAGGLAGIIVAIILRYISHVISGFVIFKSAGLIWEGLEINNSLLYSLAYNATYLLPEMVFSVIVAVILFSIPQTKKIILGK